MADDDDEEGSELGTRQHWQAAYARELARFQESNGADTALMPPVQHATQTQPNCIDLDDNRDHASRNFFINKFQVFFYSSQT